MLNRNQTYWFFELEPRDNRSLGSLRVIGEDSESPFLGHSRQLAVPPLLPKGSTAITTGHAVLTCAHMRGETAQVSQVCTKAG